MSNEVVTTSPSSLSSVNANLPNSASAGAEISKEIAMIQGTMIMAKQMPRNIEEVRSEILAMCKSPALASKALYQFPRGTNEDGKKNIVTGASIRLAEALANAFGNFRTEVNVVERTATESWVHAYAWDIQKNVFNGRKFMVSHVRLGKGNKNAVLTNERDLLEVIASQGSRRQRQCILATIPSYIVDEAIDACRETSMRQIEEQKKQGKFNFDKFLLAWQKHHVTREMIENRAGCKLEDLSPEQIQEFREIFSTIDQGGAYAHEYFPELTPKQETKVAATTDLEKLI